MFIWRRRIRIPRSFGDERGDLTSYTPHRCQTPSVSQTPNSKRTTTVSRHDYLLSPISSRTAPKLAPLHATFTGRGKDITWTPQCQQAFEDA